MQQSMINWLNSGLCAGCKFHFSLFEVIGATVQHDTSGICCIILGIQGHICFLVLLSKEIHFVLVIQVRESRNFNVLTAANLQNNDLMMSIL